MKGAFWFYGVVRMEGEEWIVAHCQAPGKNTARETFEAEWDEVASVSTNEQRSVQNKTRMNESLAQK